jgi:hypothetical protein
VAGDKGDEIEEAVAGFSPQVAGVARDMMNRKPADWSEARVLRDRIVAAHRAAESEADSIAMLFSFHALMDYVEQSDMLDEAGLRQLVGLRRADYLMMLNVEAFQGDHIDPDALDNVTKREVEAGRLAADDEFRQLAAAGAAVLGRKPAVTSKGGFFSKLFGR